MIIREIQSSILSNFFKQKIIIIYGPRQVGKTTLLNQLKQEMKEAPLMTLNCDEPDIRNSLTNPTSTQLNQLMGTAKILFIDEAQRVSNIGITLKLIVDNRPDIQVVATGSSSLDLSNRIKEPLTGRVIEYKLLPFSISELSQKYSDIELERLLEQFLITGLYPEVVEKPSDAMEILKSLTSSYLYKDILQFQDLRKPQLIEKLIMALALQTGNEVSFNELATMLGVSRITVEHYVDLLEKCFIVFRLRSFARNIRSELTRKLKIYFYDTGIRNMIISNMNRSEMRQDGGSLWENFLISERMKKIEYTRSLAKSYFWRTQQQQEIDYVEECDGLISAFEFKSGKKRVAFPQSFKNAYPNSHFEIINRDNWKGFVDKRK